MAPNRLSTILREKRWWLLAALPAFLLCGVRTTQIIVVWQEQRVLALRLEELNDIRAVLAEWKADFKVEFDAALELYIANLKKANEVAKHSQSQSASTLKKNKMLCDELAAERQHLGNLIKLAEEKGIKVPDEIKQRVSSPPAVP